MSLEAGCCDVATGGQEARGVAQRNRVAPGKEARAPSPEKRSSMKRAVQATLHFLRALGAAFWAFCCPEDPALEECGVRVDRSDGSGK